MYVCKTIVNLKILNVNVLLTLDYKQVLKTKTKQNIWHLANTQALETICAWFVELLIVFTFLTKTGDLFAFLKVACYIKWYIFNF